METQHDVNRVDFTHEIGAFRKKHGRFSDINGDFKEIWDLIELIPENFTSSMDIPLI